MCPISYAHTNLQLHPWIAEYTNSSSYVLNHGTTLQLCLMMDSGGDNGAGKEAKARDPPNGKKVTIDHKNHNNNIYLPIGREGM